MDAETWPFRPSQIPDAADRVRATLSQICTTLRRPVGAATAATARDEIAWRIVYEVLERRSADPDLGETLRLTALDAAKLAGRGDYRAAATHLSIAGLLR